MTGAAGWSGVGVRGDQILLMAPEVSLLICSGKLTAETESMLDETNR